jgi:Trm5-related predicted tRNA methylase
MSDSIKKFKEIEDDLHLFVEHINTVNSRTMYPGDIEVTMDQPKKDSYVQLVKAKFEQRSQTGIEKYNTTLERKDLDLQEWLNHLQEELMDATLYIERLKAEVK